MYRKWRVKLIAESLFENSNFSRLNRREERKWGCSRGDMKTGSYRSSKRPASFASIKSGITQIPLLEPKRAALSRLDWTGRTTSIERRGSLCRRGSANLNRLICQMHFRAPSFSSIFRREEQEYANVSALFNCMCLDQFQQGSGLRRRTSITSAPFFRSLVSNRDRLTDSAQGTEKQLFIKSAACFPDQFPTYFQSNH